MESPRCHTEVVHFLVSVGLLCLVWVPVEAALELPARRGGGGNRDAVETGAQLAMIAPMPTAVFSLIDPTAPAESHPHAQLEHRSRRTRHQKEKKASPGSSRRAPDGVPSVLVVGNVAVGRRAAMLTHPSSAAGVAGASCPCCASPNAAPAVSSAGVGLAADGLVNTYLICSPYIVLHTASNMRQTSALLHHRLRSEQNHAG